MKPPNLLSVRVQHRTGRESRQPGQINPSDALSEQYRGSMEDGDSIAAHVGWAWNTDVLKRNLSEIQQVDQTLIGAIAGVTDPSEGEPSPARSPEEDEHLAVRERFKGEGPR